MRHNVHPRLIRDKRIADRRLTHEADDMGDDVSVACPTIRHRSLNEVARYTREASQVALADDAMTMLRKAETRTTGV